MLLIHWDIGQGYSWASLMLEGLRTSLGDARKNDTRNSWRAWDKALRLRQQSEFLPTCLVDIDESLKFLAGEILWMRERYPLWPLQLQALGSTSGMPPFLHLCNTDLDLQVGPVSSYVKKGELSYCSAENISLSPELWPVTHKLDHS